MSVLDELEAEFARVAASEGTVRPRRRWWRRAALLSVLPVGGVAAVAVAATGLLTGTPVKDPPYYHPEPHAGLGVADASRARLLDVSAPDPAGGPAWGLRLTPTSRGFSCLQVGRVVDGRVGVLGRDGAFGDDGRFHEIGSDAIGRADCEIRDAAGHAFMARSYSGLPDSGYATSCAVNRVLAAHGLPACPRGSLRILYYGLLGPSGRAVTYLDDDGHVRRAPATTGDGAYLVVLRPSARRPVLGRFSLGVTPGSGLRSVEYRDGSVCRIRDPRALGGAKSCPLKGYVAQQSPRVTRAQLDSPLHAAVAAHAERPTAPGAPAGAPASPLQRKLTLAFRARVAGDARSFYTVWTQLHSRGGAMCKGASFGPIMRDVQVGQIVRYESYVPASCHGTVDVAVGYAQPRRPGQTPFSTDRISDDDRVGRVSLRLP